MPKSQAPKRPYAGNKFLIQSKEYQTVQRQLTDLVVQVQLLQRVVLEMLPQPTASEDLIRTSPEVTQEEWDQYEADQDAILTAAAEEAALPRAANEDLFQEYVKASEEIA